jgi:CheY-like chemotaxis protein
MSCFQNGQDRGVVMAKDKIPHQARILAVDDLPGNLVALDAVLGKEYELILADSGIEAISILKNRQDIDVILMDIQMPDMDGYEAAQNIKKIAGCEDIPIIFITAIYKEEPFVRKGYEVGGVDYFSKPFDPEILKRKVAIYSAFRMKSAVLKERERQIKETEELLKAGRKLSSVLESLPIGVLISDVEGSICQINETASRIFKSVEPIQKDAYGEVLGWWDSSGKMIKDQDGPLSHAIHNGETSHNSPIEIECFDGTKKMILVSAAPLYGLDHKIVGAVVIIQDITESKKIEEDLEERVTKLVSLGVEIEQSIKD